MDGNFRCLATPPPSFSLTATTTTFPRPSLRFSDSRLLYRFSADEIAAHTDVPRSKWNPVKLIPDVESTQHRIAQMLEARSNVDNLARAFSALVRRLDDCHDPSLSEVLPF